MNTEMTKRLNAIWSFRVWLVVVHLLAVLSLSSSAPCDILANKMQSSRIEFDESTPVNTVLYELPFDVSSPGQISDIKFKSNELNETSLSQYFEIIELKKFILKSTYDLDTIEIDLIELVFTCTANSGQLSNSFLLYITINDVNDNKPEFVDVPYKFQIRELTQIGTIVYQNIEAVDKDLPNKPNSQISFSIQEGNCSSYFGFPLTTKSDLAVVKLIHYDQLGKCELTIKAEDHGSPALSSTTVIEITVIDTDDKDPAFSNAFYSGIIKRNSLPGTLINVKPNDINAFDQDTGINATIKYALRGNPNELFAINADTGQLSLHNAISDNDKSEFGLIVKAFQENNPLKSALAMVNIEILNVNEYAPVFEKTSYEIKTKENTKIGTQIGQVKAEDRDRNRIEYSIINNHESPFLIDKHKGILMVNGRLDYEMRSSYSLIIVASDGNHTTQIPCKIYLTNLVDKEPYFEFDNYSFKLKIPYDVYIGQVRAIDVENTGNLKYSLKFNDSADSSLFCISQNGIIYICPSVSSMISQSPKFVNSNESKNYFALNNLNDEEIKSKFKKNFYTFNVSARIYSRDMMTNLENHVQCRIEIDYRHQIGNGINSINSAGSSSSLIDYEYNSDSNGTYKSIQKPPVFLSEHFFKDTTTVYVFGGVMVSAIVLLVLCGSALVWFKCGRIRSKRNNNSLNRYIQHHHRHDQCDHYFHNKAPFRNMFNAMSIEKVNENSHCQNANPADLAGITNVCFSSSSASSISECGNNHHSCQNSTSGISCLSDGSTILTNSKFNLIELKNSKKNNCKQEAKPCDCSFKLSSIKALDYLKWQEKNRNNSLSGVNVDTSTTSSDSSPTSKLTILSEYFCNESQYIKSAKLLTDQHQHQRESKPEPLVNHSCSSTASTLKNRNTPILVRQGIEDNNCYDHGNLTDSSSIQQNTDFLQINQKSLSSNKSKKSKLKTRNDKNRITAMNDCTHSTTSFRPAISVYSASSSSSSSSSGCNSPKHSILLSSFLPTEKSNTSLEKNRNMFSFVYNYHEPLSGNCETNLDNNEKTIYEDIKHIKEEIEEEIGEEIGEELEEEEDGLNIMETQSYQDIAPISDSSFVSASVDKFSCDEQMNSSESSLSEVTPLQLDELNDIEEKNQLSLKLSVSTSTSSFSSLSMIQSPCHTKMQSIHIKYFRLDEFDSILENETLV